jgi:membrane-associated phospholipid phosphatase
MRKLPLVLLWMLAIAVAAMLDRFVAAHVHALGIDQFMHQHKLLRETIKLGGFYPFTMVLAAIVGFFHAWRWRGAVLLLLFTLVAALNEPIKWIVGRTRPFKSLSGQEAPLAPFHLHPFPPLGSKDLSFPSGHASLAFAMAAALAILLPRFRWLFYLCAIVVGLERIGENAHWLSDVVAAAALGICGVEMLRRMFLHKFSRKPHG